MDKNRHPFCLICFTFSNPATATASAFPSTRNSLFAKSGALKIYHPRRSYTQPKPHIYQATNGENFVSKASLLAHLEALPYLCKSTRGKTFIFILLAFLPLLYCCALYGAISLPNRIHILLTSTLKRLAWPETLFVRTFFCHQPHRFQLKTGKITQINNNGYIMISVHVQDTT